METQSNRSSQRETVLKLAEDTHNNSVALARISAEIEQIARTVSSLASVVRDGNGNSLVTRLALVEKRLGDIEESIEGISCSVEQINADKIKAQADMNLETVKGKYNIAFGVLTGIIGIIGTLLALWARGVLQLAP